MQTVKDKNIDKITILINSDAIDSTMVSDLVAAVENSPGKSSLYFQIHDTEGNFQLRSKARKVELSHQLMQFLDQAEGMTYTIN